jgi:hypothetical protein
MANGLFGGGAGTALNPYIVEDALDFNAIRNGLAFFYVQKNDIDLGITYSNFVPFPTFTGTFDGRNFKLKNLKIEQLTTDFIGLVKSLAGKFLNTILENPIIKGKDYVGSFAGKLTGGVTHLINSRAINTNVSGNTRVGGMVGAFPGDMNIIFVAKNSWSSGLVTSTGSNSGGFVGELYDNYSGSTTYTIENCYSTCEVVGNMTVGGFVGECMGEASSALRYCYSSGNITGNMRVGGFVGYLWLSPTFGNNYSLAKTIRRRIGQSDTRFGDFAGDKSYTYTNCFALSSVQFIES